MRTHRCSFVHMFFQRNCNLQEYPSDLSARFNGWLWSKKKTRKFNADSSTPILVQKHKKGRWENLLDTPIFAHHFLTDILVQGVHWILCFFLKMFWIFLTLPVLLQRWSSTCHLVVQAWSPVFTPRKNRERSQSPEYILQFSKKHSI